LRTSKLELCVYSGLYMNGIYDFLQNFPLCVDGFFHQPDLLFLEPSVLAVEVDGCYWHRCQKHFPVEVKGVGHTERDKEVNLFYERVNIPYIRFYECQIKENLDGVIREIISRLELRKCPDKSL
jgi:hypothetical protein